ncbi:MAG: hypothetical protein IPM97_03560 [Bdellovibrionaceae bacterium]|nr:hypothetical protein [Pseudobdellovibrionaceae bacterium]
MKKLMTLSLLVIFPALCFAGGGGGGPSKECAREMRELLFKCTITSVIEKNGGIGSGGNIDFINSELNKLITVTNSNKTTVNFTRCAADDYEMIYVNIDAATPSIFSNSTFYQNRQSPQHPKTVRRFNVGSFLSSIREGLDFPLIDSIKFELDEEKHILTMREYVYTGWSDGPQSQHFDYAKVVCE